jgi:hypothetical protein
VALPPRLGREAAVARAREGLGWDLRVRSRLRLGLSAVDLVEARLGHVPFWLGYYGEPGSRVRARAVHGVERALASARTTHTLLRALDTAT